MSVETPNRLSATGIFAPVPAAPFTAQMVSTKGIRAFTRSAAGQYIVELEQPIAFEEGFAMAILPPNVQGTAGAQILPDGTVFVSALTLATGVPFDPSWIGVSVFRWSEGEGLSVGVAAPPVPPPIPPGGGGSLQDAYDTGPNADIVMVNARPIQISSPTVTAFPRLLITDNFPFPPGPSVNLFAARDLCSIGCSPGAAAGIAAAADGGTTVVAAGSGGNGNVAFPNGGNAGSLQLNSAPGGTGDAAAGNGGNGGTLSVFIGAGGDGAFGGQAGALTITLGQGGNGSVGAGGNAAALQVQGNAGGNAAGATTGGVGSQIAFSSGQGGNALAAGGSAGAGGSFSVVLGAGGSGDAAGGAGGFFDFTAGNGSNGIASGAAGGTGGGYSFTCGTGGPSVDATGGQGGAISMLLGEGGPATPTGNGGDAGNFTLTGQNGGSAAAAGAIGGWGSNITLAAGGGGLGGLGTGGQAGNINLQAGSGATGATNSAGGNINIFTGAAGGPGVASGNFEVAIGIGGAANGEIRLGTNGVMPSLVGIGAVNLKLLSLPTIAELPNLYIGPGTQQVARSTLAPVTLPFAAEINLAGAGFFLVANGNAQSSAADPGISAEANQWIQPKATVLSSMSWHSQTADATTTFDIQVNGIVVQTVALTGVFGVIAIGPHAIAAGDGVQVRHNAGTVPGRILVTLS